MSQCSYYRFSHAENGNLLIKCWDYDSLTKNELIGNVKVLLGFELLKIKVSYQELISKNYFDIISEDKKVLSKKGYKSSGTLTVACDIQQEEPSPPL